MKRLLVLPLAAWLALAVGGCVPTAMPPPTTTPLPTAAPQPTAPSSLTAALPPTAAPQPTAASSLTAALPPTAAAQPTAAPQPTAASSLTAALPPTATAAPPPTATPLPTSTPSWKLVWSDEFSGPDGSAVDATKWSFDIGDGGWGNDELEYYTDKLANASIQGGALVITAIKEEGNPVRYTSARLTTEGKGDWVYGRFEIRAQLPSGQGLWPAIWLSPTDMKYGKWPVSGEIDIMELKGQEPARLQASVHYGYPHRQQQQYLELKTGTFADGFHIFAFEWEPREMRWYMDGYQYHTVTKWYTSSPNAPYPAPFDTFFHLILNVAVGGWPGPPDDTTTFPQTMLVDYVRVYQWK